MAWKKISRTLSLAALFIGVAGFAGWVFGIEGLKRIYPGWVTMKANTALCLILAGLATALLSDENVAGLRRRVAEVCGVIIVTVGFLTFGEHLGWWRLGIDEALFHESLAAAGRSFPGRMGPASAINFVLVGLAVLMLDVRSRRGEWPAQFCALGVVAVTVLIFLAYFCGVEIPRYVEHYVSIALHTVIAFLLLAVAILLARPDRGFMAVFLADDVGGHVARRMLPAALLLPALLAWLSTVGRHLSDYGVGGQMALLATSLTLIFTGLVWWSARALEEAAVRHRAAAAARDRLAAIVDSSGDAIVSKTLNGIVTSWNAGAEQLFGYKSDEMIGQPIMRIIPSDRQDEEAEFLRRLRAGEMIEHFETVRRTKDGRMLDISVTISPVRDETGAIVGAAKIARDITPRKLAEAELAQALEATEEANRAKDNFLAILSHELRTPLTPALVAASELEGAPPSDPAVLRESVALIRRNIELEARLVDDLLDLTRITSGKLRIASEPLDLHAVLLDALAIAEPKLSEKNICVTNELAAHRHLVRGDAARLTQVFSNLLTNAAKFTPAAGLVAIRTANTDEGKLRIEVSDTGIGIAPDVLPKIFDPFCQGEVGTTRRFGGLGLGLSLAKNLIDVHGGRIEAQSEGRGRGATFSVTLPALGATRLNAEDSADDVTPAAPAGSLRVLLVEDHEDTRHVLHQLMTRWGHTVTAAGAVAQARGAIAAGSFDLLLSDISLPDGSGIEVVAALREKSNAPAVAMSGYGMDADLARARAAGFTEHIVKPVGRESLRELLAKVSATRDRQIRRD